MAESYGMELDRDWLRVVTAVRFKDRILAHPERGSPTPAGPADIENRSAGIAAVVDRAGMSGPEPA
jgi:hypothetical protein